MKKFSERMGMTKPTPIQLDDMSKELINSLWNVIYILLKEYEVKDFHGDDQIRYTLALNFFKIRIDEIDCMSWDEFVSWTRNKFYSLQWYGVYDFIEFLVQNEEPFKRLEENLNKILEQENSGYRLINNTFVPITNRQEIEAIEEALDRTSKFGLEGAKEHLSQALVLLGKKPKPDYRNSIKESISAVESLVKQLSGKDSSSLEPALKELSRKIPIHGALQKGFINLYGYTSDAGGIRHAIREDSNVGYDEAKFMLVSCSAFVNFLISKAQKAGLLKEG